jgi:hypothetical protein
MAVVDFDGVHLMAVKTELMGRSVEYCFLANIPGFMRVGSKETSSSW